MSKTMVLNEDEALALAAFLVACADICRHEPDLYGPLRLLEGAKRLAQSAAHRTMGDAHRFWQDIHAEIEQKLFWYDYDLEGWNAFVDQMPARIASELRKRAVLERRKDGP